MKRLVLGMLCVGLLVDSASAQTFWEKMRQNRHRWKVKNAKGQEVEGSVDVDKATSARKNEDGTVTVDTNATATTERHGQFQGSRSTTFGKNDQGGHSWHTKGKLAPKDGPWGLHSESSGESRRTEDGREWNKTTVVGNKKGWGAKTDAQGKWVKNPDGTWTFIKNKTTTLNNGKVITNTEETTFRKGEKGLEWLTRGKRVGANGKVADFTGGGAANLGKEGLDWSTHKEGTNVFGKKYSTQSEGQGQKTEKGVLWKRKTAGQTGDGKWKWNFNKNKNVTRTGQGRDVDTTVEGGVSGEGAEKFKAWIEKMKANQKARQGAAKKPWWKKK